MSEDMTKPASARGDAKVTGQAHEWDLQRRCAQAEYLCKEGRWSNARLELYRGLWEFLEQAPKCTSEAYYRHVMEEPRKDYELRLSNRILRLTVLGDGAQRSAVIECLKSQSEPVMIRLTSTAELEWLAYLLAHIAQCSVKVMISLFTDGQIPTIERGRRLILEEAECFEIALALDPDYTWARVHLGEVHRDLANGWSDFYPSPKLAKEIKRRHYELALRYLDKPPKGAYSTWAKAHYGATVINARAFLGADAHEDTQQKLKLAKHRLTEAVKEKGGYYPWAQAYQAGCGLLTYIDAGTAAGPHSASDWGALMSTITSFQLDSELGTGLFEPNSLGGNALLQFGDLMRQMDQFDEAWAYAVKGMHNLFNLGLIPELQTLLGCRLLMQISHDAIESKGSRSDDIERVDDDEIWLERLFDIEVPNKHFGSHAGLVSFIEQVVTQIAEPCVRPFLGEKPPNSRIETALIWAYYIMHDMLEIATRCSSQDRTLERTVEKLGENVEQCRQRIAELVKIDERVKQYSDEFPDLRS